MPWDVDMIRSFRYRLKSNQQTFEKANPWMKLWILYV